MTTTQKHQRASLIVDKVDGGRSMEQRESYRVRSSIAAALEESAVSYVSKTRPGGGVVVEATDADTDDVWVEVAPATIAVALTLAVDTAATLEDCFVARDEPWFVFVLDTSGSMAGAPIAWAKQAVFAAMNALPDGAWVSLVGFHELAYDGLVCGRAAVRNGAFRRMQYTNDNRPALPKAVADLVAYGGTDISNVLRLVKAMHQRVACNAMTVLFVTDGQVSDVDATLEEATWMRGQGIRIMTLGIGEAQQQVIQGIAMATGGQCRIVKDDASASRLGQAVNALMTLALLPEVQAVNIDVDPALRPFLRLEHTPRTMSALPANRVVVSFLLSRAEGLPRSGSVTLRGLGLSGPVEFTRRFALPAAGDCTASVTGSVVTTVTKKTRGGPLHAFALCRAACDEMLHNSRHEVSNLTLTAAIAHGVAVRGVGILIKDQDPPHMVQAKPVVPVPASATPAKRFAVPASAAPATAAPASASSASCDDLDFSFGQPVGSLAVAGTSTYGAAFAAEAPTFASAASCDDLDPSFPLDVFGHPVGSATVANTWDPFSEPTGMTGAVGTSTAAVPAAPAVPTFAAAVPTSSFSFTAPAAPAGPPTVAPTFAPAFSFAAPAPAGPPTAAPAHVTVTAGRLRAPASAAGAPFPASWAPPAPAAPLAPAIATGAPFPAPWAPPAPAPFFSFGGIGMTQAASVFQENPLWMRVLMLVGANGLALWSDVEAAEDVIKPRLLLVKHEAIGRTCAATLMVLAMLEMECAECQPQWALPARKMWAALHRECAPAVHLDSFFLEACTALMATP
jgi:hypothetical protein